jgi:hypothetical protein
MALQEHAADGSIERQITGFEHELRQTAQQNNSTPRVLPPTSEEQFYASLSNNGRDYELGRQFAAEPSNGIPQHLAPLDLGQFSKGLEDREFEQKIRSDQRESLVSAFDSMDSTLDLKQRRKPALGRKAKSKKSSQLRSRHPRLCRSAKTAMSLAHKPIALNNASANQNSNVKKT